MADKKIYRLYTFHRTEIFCEGARRIFHRNVEEVPADHLPIYALRADDGISLFFVADNKINYIREFIDSENFSVDAQPSVLECVNNADGSISFKQNNKFISARLETGQFDLRPKNLDWEHFFLDEVNFTLDELININQNNFKLPSFATMHTPFKISIVIPLLDGNSAIENTLNSIINQTSQEFEVIIVKGLRAEVPNVIGEFENSFGDKLAIVDAAPANIGSLFNVGIQCSNGQYVMLLESGDTLAPSALKNLYLVAEQRKADAIFCAPVNDPVSVPLDEAKRIHDFVKGRFGYNARARLLSRKFLAVRNIEIPNVSALDEMLFSFFLACRVQNYVLMPDQLYQHRAEVEEIAIDKNFFVILNDAFEVLDKFMRDIDLFNRRPEFKFIVFDRFNECCKKYLRQDNLTPYQFYESTLKLVRENRSTFNRTAFLSYNFNSANYQYAQLLKKERRIKELNDEIKKLKG